VNETGSFYRNERGGGGTHIALRWNSRLRFTVSRESAAQEACWRAFRPGPLEYPLRAMARLPRLLGAVGCGEAGALVSIREAIGREAGLSCCRDGGSGLWSKDTILLLDKPTNRPLFFVKAGFGKAIDPLLQNEASWLQELRDRPRLAHHVPDLIFHRSGADSPFIVQRALLGGFDNRLRDSQFDFLQKFQREYLRTIRFEESTLHKDLLSRLKDLRGRLTPAWSTRIDKALRQIERPLSGPPILMVAAHNDFTPWNIRVEHSVAQVFDWEYAKQEQFPLFDPLHFMLMPLALARRRTTMIVQMLQETLQLCNLRFGREYCYEAETQSLAYFVNICTLFLWGVRGGDVSHPVLDSYAQVIDHMCCN
jgi:hypothetical protein